MERLIAKLNVEAIPMFFEMDGHFPNHHPDPTVEKNLIPLKEAVAHNGAELGIAFDGDADRIGAVAEDGRVAVRNVRRDARKQLEIAHEMFAQMGMQAFAERALRELRVRSHRG